MNDKTEITRNLQQGGFPNITDDNWEPTSPYNPRYNCIAWAASNDTIWWWPDEDFFYYWPADVKREETLEAFIDAYGTLGFEVCDDGELEEGYEKIVIYLDARTGKPTHAARLLKSGMWTSKLGQNIDISHLMPEVIEGPAYGEAAQYMKRLI